jgi:hypothetical protein
MATTVAVALRQAGGAAAPALAPVIPRRRAVLVPISAAAAFINYVSKGGGV